MKIAIILCAVIGCAVASSLYEDNSYGKAVNTGRSQVMRKDDGHGNYEFGYDEEHHTGGTSRREKGGKGWQQGSYEIRDKDGRKRIVTYVADAHGFRAKIDTNEQGVDAKQDPADVNLNSHGSLGYPQQIAYIAKAEPTISYLKAQPSISYIKSEPSYGYSNIESRGNSYGGNSYGNSYGDSYASAPVKMISVEPQGKSWASGYESSWNGPSYGSSYGSNSKY